MILLKQLQNKKKMIAVIGTLKEFDIFKKMLKLQVSKFNENFYRVTEENDVRGKVFNTVIILHHKHWELKDFDKIIAVINTKNLDCDFQLFVNIDKNHLFKVERNYLSYYVFSY